MARRPRGEKPGNAERGRVTAEIIFDLPTTTKKAKPDRAHVARSVRVRNLSGNSRHVPVMDRLLQEGRASRDRIRVCFGFRKAILIEWLAQAQRLWLAAEVHKL